MRKFTYILIIIAILFIAGLERVSAVTYESTVGSDSIVLKKNTDNGMTEIKSIGLVTFNGNSYFGIRQLSEACGATINWIEETKSIKVESNGSVMLFSYNSTEIFINGNKYDFGKPVMITDGVSYAPIEIYTAFTGEMSANQLAISEGSNENYTDESNTLILEKGLDSDRVIFNVNPEKIKAHFRLDSPDRIVLDLYDVDFNEEVPSGVTFERIRYSISNGVTRFVFDLNDDYRYRLNADGGRFIIDISESGAFLKENTSVEFRNNSIILNTGDYEGYRISRSSDPFTIDVFIPGFKTGGTLELDGDGILVEKIYAYPSEDGARISIVTKFQCAFELEKTESNFIIGIYEPVVNGLTYHNKDEIHSIQISGIELSGNNEAKIEQKSNGTHVSFDDPDNLITEGQVYINDGIVKSIFVTRNGSKVTIRIDGISKIYPEAVRESGGTVLYLNDNDLSGRLVVISAGHGGRDPGAVKGDIHEADINLDIALKLDSILRRMGIDTLMIRTDDTFYSLDDRVLIANKNNAALFISIHSNALDDPDFDGLMTLVHSGAINYKKINGRTAGEIIHKSLIDATGATDRGVRFRDNIIVLKDTAMPAVEIEAGFLTNEAELVKLLDDTYQMTIAEAAASGIAEVLEYID